MTFAPCSGSCFATIALALGAVVALESLTAQSTPRQLADILPGPVDLTPDSLPRGFTEIQGRVVFHAVDPRLGRELYVHDANGTRLLREFLPGDGGGLADYASFYRVGNVLLFSCQDSPTTLGLYRTDGTVSGTHLLSRIPGLGLAGESAYTDGTRLWFSAYESGFGVEPWVSDGTRDGTYRIADIRPGGESSISTGSAYGVWQGFQGRTYFRADDGVHGPELWVTDGSAAGTRMVVDGNPGELGLEPGGMVELNGRLMFVARRDQLTNEWWSTDGTAQGTARVSGWPVMSTLRDNLAVLGDKLLFRGLHPLYGNELFVTDGTPQGTGMVKDIWPGSHFSGHGPMVVWNGFVWWNASDGSSGSELWRTDGTEAGTSMVVEVCPGAAGGIGYGLAVMPSGLVFAGRTDARDGWEPWITDGTPAGTRPIADLLPGGEGSLSAAPVVAGTEAWFAARTPASGSEPWKTDGTAAGTVQVGEIGRATADSDPQSPAADSGLRLVFQATNATIGQEPWITDGTPTGTRLWRDAQPGSFSSAPARAARFGDRTWWTNRESLITSDLLGGDLRPILGSHSNGPDVVELGGRYYFGRRIALWSSDGTAAGTGPVIEFQVGRQSVGPTDLVAAGDLLYFFASVGYFGPTGLFVSDGTAAGTRLEFQTSFDGGSASGFRSTLALGDRALVRTLAPATNQPEYWILDGSSRVLLATLDKPARPADMVLSPRTGEALFVARDAIHGAELWATDGTPGGTRVLLDIHAGATSSEPVELTPAGGLVFFTADDGIHGRELWRTDGTTAGTRMVTDSIPGQGSLQPEHLLRLGDANAIAFQGHDAFGSELWTCDGTAAGTRRLTDLGPGGHSSHPTPLGVVGDQLVFAAYTEPTGYEPWAIDLSTTRGYLARTLGAGCPGSAGTVPTAGTSPTAPRVGAATFTLTLTDARPQAAAGVLFDLAAHPTVLGGCTLWLPGAPVGIPLPTDAQGDAMLWVPIPADPALAGMELFAQWLVSDPGGSLGGALSASGLTHLVVGR